MAEHRWNEYTTYNEDDVVVPARRCFVCRQEQTFVKGKTPGRLPEGRWLPTIAACKPGQHEREHERERQRWARRPPSRRKSARWMASIRQLSRRAQQQACTEGAPPESRTQQT